MGFSFFLQLSEQNNIRFRPFGIVLNSYFQSAVLVSEFSVSALQNVLKKTGKNGPIFF